MTPPDLDQAAIEPSSVSNDGQSVSARPISELIALDKYQAAKAAIGKRRRGMFFTKLINEGTLSDGGSARGGCDFGRGCC